MSDELLVLRRGGITWALAWHEVRSLTRHGTTIEIGLANGRLAADEVVGVVPHLRVHSAGAALRRFWPAAARGLAVHAGQPLVLIDVQAPPAALRCPADDPASPASAAPSTRRTLGH